MDSMTDRVDLAVHKIEAYLAGINHVHIARIEPGEWMLSDLPNKATGWTYPTLIPDTVTVRNAADELCVFAVGYCPERIVEVTAHLGLDEFVIYVEAAMYVIAMHMPHIEVPLAERIEIVELDMVENEGMEDLELIYAVAARAGETS